MRPIDADAVIARVDKDIETAGAILNGKAPYDVGAQMMYIAREVKSCLKEYLDVTPTLDYVPVQKIDGSTSDGYHTFNELYHHRALLFAVIVSQFKDIAWKSKLHHDGTMYDGMFIVGVNTLQGQATYHYDLEPYWDIFNCKELELAPEWDGHTSEQAIERIASLRLLEPFEKAAPQWISVKDRLPPDQGKKVLVANGHGYISVFALWKKEYGNKWTWIDERGHFKHTNDITHWMPLPEKPKEG